MGLVLDIVLWLLTALTVVSGVVYLVVWTKRGFWIPAYVHVLAFFSFFAGALLGLLFISQGTPLTDTRLGTYMLAVGLAVGLPIFVYFWFVFFGGAEAAHERRRPPQEDDPIEP